MKREIEFFIWSVGLGIMLIAYAHATFSTKETVVDIHDDIKIIQADVKEILKGMR